MLQKLHTLGRLRLAVVAAIALLAVVLLGGTLFAANERQGPEDPPLSRQLVADATDPATVADLPVAPSAPERVFSQPADDEIRVQLPPVTKQPPSHPNLDANLNQLVEDATGSQNPASTDGSASAPSADPVLVTFYVEAQHVDGVRQYLEDNGVYVRNVGEDYIEAHVPPLLLPAASQQPGVLRVDTVIPPLPAQSQSRVISQGVGLHGSDVWHNAGYRGQGVKIGIIDLGFEQFSELQQGGELPPNVFARCYFDGPQQPSSRLSDCEVDDVHGTAVAETAIDVAPDAQLYIAQPNSPGDLRNAVDWMAGQGVQVINISLGYVPDGPGDGTSPFSNSPLRTLDVAVASGITVVIAAGNNARNVWYGVFSDTDGDGGHNFSGADEGNAFALPEGGRVRAFLRWDDDWGTADCDLDLELWRRLPSGEWILVLVDNKLQDGSPGSIPLAIISSTEATAAQAGLYDFGITKHSCAEEPAWIQLTAWIDDDLQYYSPGHHMGNPEESRNPGLLAVGATHYWDTDTIASYSSRGPTIDGRTKPDIAGVACGRSTVYPLIADSQCWFRGTSQAAPHVAGMAALVKQRSPDFTPDQLARFLMDNAQERGAAGPDNTWGNGFATLPNPSVSLAPTKVGTIADMMLTVDQMSTIDVSTYFIDHDGDMLTYTAGSSDAMIATATVSGSMLTIEGKMEGTATITVNATDLAGSGMSATQTFDVTVTAEFVAPVITTTNPVGSGIVLVSWDSVAGAAGYALIASNLTNPSGETRTAAAGRDATAGQIQGLTVGDEYLIFVGAFNAQLEFELSAFVRVTAE